MSFVPHPQRQNATSSNNAVATPASTQVEAQDDGDIIFNIRTFDLYFVDRAALMYKDGIAKSFDKESRKTITVTKQRSSIPLILRDMAPPEGSIFDPAKKWEEEKERRRLAAESPDEQTQSITIKSKKTKKNAGGKKITADSIKESNAAEKLKKELERDLQKLSNLRSLKALQETSCETSSGQINRMVKMLHVAVSDFQQGSVSSSEAEILDILWALEEMPAFKKADLEVAKEKNAKKEAKEQDKAAKKKDKKEGKKDKKQKKKDEPKEAGKIILSAEAAILKSLYKEGGDGRGSYKDSLKFARKLMSSKESIISFQLTNMPDRLPPLSRYNRKFKLEEWQCMILDAIDRRQSAVVCAPTSSGKTLLSTYTCKNANGTVLFVLPSEVLVWQVASTYYQFFKGNVTVCTDLITFQEVTGEAQVYIGTPRALEASLSKARGVAGEEMAKGEREFMILDGGYHQFDYLVLDEVHTLNGPEGDALQRIIKTCNCPVLALSATIGNALQLKEWFEAVQKQHLQVVNASSDSDTSVILKEHFARFINLQRYVVTETESKDGRVKVKLVKLHPVAAMTRDRLKEQPDLIAALSLTPTDLVDLWKRMRSIFPATVLEESDDPDYFFGPLVDESKRISLNQTKEYEMHLKGRLSELSESHPDLFERLREAQMPPPLEAQVDVSEKLYDVVEQLKRNDLLPAVAFQLNTYGAFNMFKILLSRLESEQVLELPDYRKDLIKMAREKAQMRKVAAGKASRENAAEAEEEAKAGFVDDSLVQEDTTKPHDKYVLSSAGKRLSYNEVEDIVADMKKSGEAVDINHALIRGLRRGIAIYTNEVGFSCYRRQVQMLAQKGRLAVVFSDDALAYGVNMPFRTCIFCGDMGENLTPLIAQQMQGRAGRRGLDVQGNVVYLGMEWPYIENLMLGQISKVTGREPRYPIMCLQHILASANDPDHDNFFIHDEKSPFASALRRLGKFQDCFPTITEEQMHWMCETTLEEFCKGETSDHYFDLSVRVLRGLQYIHEDNSLAMDHNVLSMVWEMHNYLPEAVHLVAVLEQMYIRFCYNKTKSYKESDAAQNEFLSVLLHVIDRVELPEGEESLQDILRVSSSDGKQINEDARDMWIQTEKILCSQGQRIESLALDPNEEKLLCLALPVGDDPDALGPALDGGVYTMLVSKQKGFPKEMSSSRRNELKSRIVRVARICQIVHNNIQQPHGKFSALEVLFRKVFKNTKYSIADMMNQLTDQADLTEV